MRATYRYLTLVGFFALVVIIICSIPSNASADTHTLAASGNAGDGATWVGGVAPEAGDDLILTGAYNLALNQAIAYGNITLQASYSGTATQGAVNFGYFNFNMAAGTWKGVTTNTQTCSGNFIRTGGTLTSNALNLIMTGDGKTLALTGTLQSLTISGNIITTGATSINSSPGFIKVDSGKTLTISALYINVRYYASPTVMTINGTIISTGSGFFAYDLYNTGKDFPSLTNINCPVKFRIVSGSSSATLTMTAAVIHSYTLEIHSQDATNTLTLKTAGKNLSITSLTIGLRGVFDADAATITCSYLFDAVNGTYTPDTSKLVIRDGGVAKFGTAKPYNMELTSTGLSNLIKIYATSGTVFWNVTGMNASHLCNYYINGTYSAQVTTSAGGSVARSNAVVGLRTFELREVPYITTAPISSPDYTRHTLAELMTYYANYSADQTVTWTLTTDAAFLSWDGHSLTGTPGASDSGTYSIVLTATNANGAVSVVSFVVVDDTTNEHAESTKAFMGMVIGLMAIVFVIAMIAKWGKGES